MRGDGKKGAPPTQRVRWDDVPVPGDLADALSKVRVHESGVKVTFRSIPPGWTGSEVPDEAVVRWARLDVGPHLVYVTAREQDKSIRRKVVKGIHRTLRMPRKGTPASALLDGVVRQVRQVLESQVLDGAAAERKALREHRKRREKALGHLRQTIWDHRGVLSKEDVVEAWELTRTREVMEA